MTSRISTSQITSARRLSTALDDAFGGCHPVGRVADGEGVEARNRGHASGAECHAQQIHGLLEVGVGEVERLDDLLLVLLALLGRVGKDEDDLLVHHAVQGLAGRREGREGLLEGDVPQVERDGGVGEARVEDEVDADGAAQRLVGVLEPRASEDEPEGLLGRRAEGEARAGLSPVSCP